MTASGTAANNSRPWRDATVKDLGHTRRLCKCHTPAMGHHFGGDDLRCRCGCGILTHWRKPQRCTPVDVGPISQFERRRRANR